MRKLILAGFFFMLISTDWAWSASPSFVPTSFSAKFVQVIKSRLSNKIKESNGKVDYKFPSNIRFEMNGSTDFTIVSNDKKLWYFTPSSIKGEPSQLRISKASNSYLSHFFDILKDGLKSNKNYKVKKEKTNYRIIFEKKVSKKLKYKGAVLVFGAKGKKFKNLKEIHLIKKKNQIVKMVFSKIIINKKFPSNHFIFNAPEGTRLTN